MKRVAGLLIITLFCTSLVASIPPVMDWLGEPTGNPSLEEIQELFDQTTNELGINETAITQTAQEMMMSSFQENLGQISNLDVLFYGNIPGGMIGFCVSKILIWLEGTPNSIELTFVDGAMVTPEKSNVVSHATNYFLGDRGTFTDVQSFQEVIYRNLWNGIDLVYKATQQGAKYEYRVHPGANPEDIRIESQGHDSLFVSNGSLRFSVNDMVFFDDGLVVTQESDQLPASFQRYDNFTFGFSVPEYDVSKMLTIDPIIYSTFVGGSDTDLPFNTAIDSQGCAYVTGYTLSLDFPAVNIYGDYVESGSVGSYDIMVYKLNSTGNGMLFTTIIGGSDSDQGSGIDVDSNGTVYITGYSKSSDFPTYNAYNSNYIYGYEVVVIKLNSTGNGLLFSTYVSASAYYDIAYDLALDNDGDIFVTGYTNSPNFPRINAYDSTHNGEDDCFIFKMSSTGSEILYSTFFGGTADDESWSIALDNDGNAYITGRTYSSDLPIVNGFDTSFGGVSEGFVVKINSTGNGLTYSSYLGGNDTDYAWGIAVDNDNEAYVIGQTLSSDFPTQSAYDSTHNGGADCFITKFSASGNSLIYSSFIGGAGGDVAYSVYVDARESAYIIGRTSSSDFPTMNALDDTLSGMDTFVLKLNPFGTNLLYSTFFEGTSGTEYARGFCVDDNGYAYFAVLASSDMPTVSAYDSSSNGNGDAGSVKIADMGDSDSDGLQDYYELLNGTDRYDPDSDNDSLSDYAEVIVYNSDPLNASDPAWVQNLGFSLYIGGSSTDVPRDIVVDSLGNVYVTGETYSFDFPTLNGLDDTLNGIDIFLMKIGPHGNQLLWSTYIGGSMEDTVTAIVVDSLNNVYLTGYTTSPDFPTINAYMDTYTYQDCFVLKINSAGDTLVYSTFVAGETTDSPEDLVVDAAGNAYVTGYTYSLSFPTFNAYDETHNGLLDTFVFKLNSAGSGLHFSTYIGGQRLDYPRAIAIDTSSNVYVTGETDSIDFPVKNPLDGYINGDDIFLLKLNSTGNGLEFSTFFGGNDYEYPCGVSVDLNGDIYVAGTAYGLDFPRTKMIGTSDESDDIFVLKLNSTGNGMIYCTIIAGTDSDYPYSMSVDSSGAVYVATPTDSVDLPEVNPVGTPNGDQECYVMKLSPNGQYLEFASYIGGAGFDNDPYLAIDHYGRMYVTGYTTGGGLFPLLNSTGSTYTGTPDAFVMRIDSTGDSDLDGMPDLWENQYALNPNSAADGGIDLDSDLLTNFEEYKYGGSPHNNDTDSDTINDFDEATVYLTNPGSSDSDGDLIPDQDEIGVHGTSPILADSDFDGLDDYSEIFTYFTDPNLVDSDSDAVTDEREIVGYATDPLNSSQPEWTEWLGFTTAFGTEELEINDMVVDQFDNVFIVGSDLDSSFVMKFDSEGTLIFITYMGGDGWDSCYSINVSPGGVITVAGITSSVNLPTVNAFDATLNGSNDFMIFRLDATGSTLLYLTYLGGSAGEEAVSLSVDSSDRIYISGSSLSDDYPTVNAIYDTKDTQFDLVATRISSDGSTIEYSTFIGGDSSDWCYDNTVDDDGNHYLAGHTLSSNFPTVNAFDSSSTTGNAGFVVKINSTGSGIDYSTFIENTIGQTTITAIEVDGNGVAYLTGYTNTMTGFPIVNHDNSTIYSSDGSFVTLLNNTGSEILYSSIITGGWPIALDIDDFGCVYVAGQNYDVPIIGGYNASYNEGGDDAFLFKLDTLSHSLEFSASIGGRDDDMCPAMMLDSYSRPVLACFSESLNFPLIGPFSYPLPYSYGVLLRIEVGDLDLDNIPDTWEDANGLDKNNASDASLDPDLDTLSNFEEYLNRCDPNNNDTDLDNLNDWAEIFTYGTNPRNNDSDFDSMPDNYEVTFGLNPVFDDSAGDLDFDTLNNFQEYLIGTLPNSNDTDFDLIPDDWEFYNGLDPLFDDAGEDPDSDTLSNYLEYTIGSDLFNNDSDFDLLLDADEYYTYGTNLTNSDSDFDTLSDYLEVIVYGTNPLSPHSDADIMPDAWEVLHSLDPLVDDSLGDPDSDLLLNEDEYTWGTDPQNPDTDSDAFTDGYEVHTLGSNPLDPDSPFLEKEPMFSTFIGGSGDDVFYDAIVDSAGNTYLTGYSYSSNFPTVGAYDSSINGNRDAVIVKLNSTGNGIIFSTYIGGSSIDQGLEFHIESDFSIFLSGYTTSTNFPTVNAYDSSHNGGWDGFIVHLSANGTTLLYSTYIGGSGDDSIEYMAFDKDGYFYCAGVTRSSNFPVVNAYDSTFNGDRDVVAFKMTPTLDALVYSTYIGGSAYDNPYGARLADDGELIISGRAASSNFPTINGYDTTHNGNYDIFVTRLNASGNGLIFSTFIGGSGEEYFGKFEIDRDENMYIGGSTASTNFPVLNAYDDTHNGGWDAFALKLASNGSSLYFSTFIGGSGSETVYGVAVDRWNNIHLSGVTTSTNLPIMNAFQNTSQGADDTFVFKVNSTGNGLLYSTYLGGSSNDGQRGMAIDQYCNVYIVGWTSSTNHPVVNALDDSHNGGLDGFVTCLPPLDDTDKDGLPDDVEISLGTNRLATDSDLDLMPDGWEYFNGLDPTVDDAADDIDSDLLSNYMEYLLDTIPNESDTDSDTLSDGDEYYTYGTNPLSDDTDSDDMPDAWEINNSLDPLLDDASNDPDLDDLSNLFEFTYLTNPHNNDTDSDSMPDGWEISVGLNATLDDAGDDTDIDTLTNLQEYQFQTDPLNNDTDSDFLDDAYEIYTYGTSPIDPDEDNDLLLDGLEFAAGTSPFLNDTDGDLYTDYAEVVSFGSDPLNDRSPTYTNALPYSTYIGGVDYDHVKAIALDSAGNVIVAGYCYLSFGLPLVQPFDNTSSASYPECFILKLNSTLNGIIFSTFFGGSDTDQPADIKIDSENCIYMAGRTISTDLMTVNAFDTTHGGNWDVFVLKFAANGSTLLYCSYLGGSNQEYEPRIDIDVSGNLYVVGTTWSSNFPLVNAYDASFAVSEAYVTKIDTTGSTIAYSTFIGGTREEIGSDICVDDTGAAYVTGRTRSSNFPIVNAFDSTIGGDTEDCVVFKLSPDGSTLVYSSFFGGSMLDTGIAIDIDSSGCAYVTGYTRSTNIMTVNAFDDSHNGEYDFFVFKVNPDGTTLNFSTYLGGSGIEYPSDLYLDSRNDIYVVGYTSSSNIPLENQIDSIRQNEEIYLAKLATDGSFLLYATFFGGSERDEGYAVTVDSNGTAYVVGRTLSQDFPLVNEIDGNAEGDYDGFITCILDIGDSDRDGLSDLEEIDLGTDRFDADTDDDLANDGDELILYGTDPFDNDTDNDSMLDGWEGMYGLDPLTDDSGGDLDSDGLTNAEEALYGSLPHLVDSDSDTLDDYSEVFVHGTNPGSSDTDSDLMPDNWELSQGTDPVIDDAAGDLDTDSLSNYLEYTLGWSANDNDTEDDLMPDGWEYLYGLNGLVDDSAGDIDGDLLTNLQEYQFGCSPISVDGDGDTLTDYDEIMTYGTHPGLADTDFDTLNDNVEITVYLTNPLSNDTDSDLMSDGYEVFFGLNPLADDASLDLDSDGLTNYEESVVGTTPTHPDTDLDNLSDGDEVHLYGSDPFRIDTDFDSIMDFYEVHNGLNVTRSDAFEDLDSDGLLNYDEYLIGTAANNTDSDFDGPSDLWEYEYGFNPLVDDSSLDPDNDGLDNAGEYSNDGHPWIADSDSDSLLDGLEALIYFTDLLSNDTDSDLMSDGWEVNVGLNPLVDDSGADPDGDTLTNLQECSAGTHPLDADCDNDGARDDIEILQGCDPLNPDTDNDFMPDGFEIQHGLDPLVPDADDDLDSDTLTNLREYLLSTDPSDSDSDDDSVSDGDEYRIYNTSPHLNDTDGDSLEDGYEIFTLGSNPLKADSDDDLLSDADEVLIHGTSPINSDTDSDMLDDYTEVIILGTSPISNDTDSDTMTDLFEVDGGLDPLSDDSLGDLDGDTLLNIDEFLYGTMPDVADSDDDTLSDGSEVHIYGSNPLSRDSDADTIPDGYEAANGLNPAVDDRTGDVDSDGLTNYIEFIIGTHADDADSDQDTMPDGWEFDAGLNPMLDDSAGDADSDTLSNIEEYGLGTQPMSRDTDRDSMSDGWEHNHGLDPLVDDAHDDMDGDGLDNLQEYYLGLDPQLTDSDEDQLSDSDEVFIYGTDPSDPDTDHDSVLDGVEVQMGSDPLGPASGMLTATIGKFVPIGLVAIVGIIGIIQVRRRTRKRDDDISEISGQVEEFYDIVDKMKEISKDGLSRVNEVRDEAKQKLEEMEKLSKTEAGARKVQGCREYLAYTYRITTSDKKRRG